MGQEGAGDSEGVLVVDPETQALREQYEREDEAQVERIAARRQEIARLEREIQRLYAEDDTMAALYIATYKQDIARLKRAIELDPPADLREIKERQEKRAVAEARRQAAGGKSAAKKYPPETEAQRQTRVENEARSGDEEDEEESGEESEPQEYPYVYDEEDRPSKGGKRPDGVLTDQELADKYPSKAGKRPTTTNWGSNSDDEEEEEDEDEDKEDEVEVSWEEDERRLNNRLDAAKNALDDFSEMTNQTVSNAEACHGKAKQLVELLANGAQVSEDVSKLATELLETSALTLVEAYSAEEAQERAADNLSRAADRLRGRPYPYERWMDMFNESVLNAREQIEQIQQINAM